MAAETLSPDEQARIEKLEDEGILNPKALSDDVLKAIGSLSDEEINMLKQIHRRIDLSAFINPRGPQM